MTPTSPAGRPVRTAPRTIPAAGPVLAAIGLVLWVAGPAAGQPPVTNNLPLPRLLTLTPNGGKAGTTVEVTFTGTDIDEAERLVFSVPTITAEPIETPPPNPDPKAKPAPPPPKRGPRPAKVTATKFKVVIPADAPVGIHDVRLVNKWGISNPRAFAVGDLPELTEKEPNNDVEQAQRVPLNVTVSGVISAPTDVDYFVFAGQKGQRVVISCLTSGMDSRLLPLLELYDSSRLVASNVKYDNDDALLDYTLPAAGDYFLRLTEFSHQGGSPEHFYRLTISTGPWIDAVFPPMVEPGKPATLTLHGRNLPGGVPDPAALVNGTALEKATVTVTPPADPAALTRLTLNGLIPPPSSGLDGFEYRLKTPAGSSNGVLIGFAHAPVVLATGANRTAEAAQLVPVPCEVAGRVDTLRQRDWYAFQGKKGDVYSIQLLSDRLGAPTDMVFDLLNDKLQPIAAEVDDDPEVLNPLKFMTRTADPPRYRFAVPADGRYVLKVSSKFAGLDTGIGPKHVYRLRISPEAPDFRVVVTPPSLDRPDSCVILQGGNQDYDVFLWRQDGFNDPVTLSIDGLPAGVTCAPQVIGTGMKQAYLVITAAPDAAPFTGVVTVKGTATINGQKVVREARAATITWPVPPGQGVATATRLDRSLFLAVRDAKAPFSLTASLDKPSILHDEKGTLTLKLSRLWPEFKQPLQAVAVDLPQNLQVNNNQPVTIPPDKDTVTVPVNVNSVVPPGVYNVVMRATAQIPYNKDPNAKDKPQTPVVYPSTPVTLTILPKQLANLQAAVTAQQVKPGEAVKVVVRAGRLHNYQGEFKLTFVPPAAAKGLTAEDAVIPAGQDEGTLTIKVAADAAPGYRGDLVVRAVAPLKLYEAVTPIAQETKIGVNVVK